MLPNTQTLGEVVVKGERPQYKMTTGGMTVDIQNSLMKDVGTADDVLSMLPQVQGSDGNFTVFAKGTPEIYINNKKVQNARELKKLKSTNIKVEVHQHQERGRDYVTRCQVQCGSRSRYPHQDEEASGRRHQRRGI